MTYLLRLIILCITVAILPRISNGQQIYDTRNGSSLSPHGIFRILNIYVNIIFDQTPERDVFYGKEFPVWQPGDPNKLNDNPPTYLKDFLDTDYNGGVPKGIMSRLFYESSLGNLIILGDFVSVNILQSEITPDKPGNNFGSGDIVRIAVKTINRLGGIKTVYGHDSIQDFDFLAKGNPGLNKDLQPNGKIDFVMVFIRNGYRKEENGKVLYNYGQHNSGEGNSYEGNICNKCSLLFGSKYYENEITTVQNLSVADLAVQYKNIAFHELAHNLFGSNAFHTSGGNHFGTSNAAVFIGLQGGYGLMGGYNSSLVCCNAYERWRLGWLDTVYNPQLFQVSANCENAAITKNDGTKSFILRDFVTTGDAIRIQFPYVDKGAQNQYLWLENHQIGKNGKIDFMQYSNDDDCRQPGSSGIYAFIQVGKDKLSSDRAADIFSNDETDNLRHLSAKGNWDMKIDSYYDTLICISWHVVKPAESYWLQNPLSGYNDLQTHTWDTTSNAQKFNSKSLCSYPWRTRHYGILEPPLPFMGDNATAFSGKSIMDISSNPPPVNVVTSYCTQFGQNFSSSKTKVNTRKIYLTGLSVNMEDLGNLTMKVDIRWDQYNVNSDVRWTGDIILKEQLYLEDNITLILDQNYTPNQLFRDSISNVFSSPTVLTCESGSIFKTGKKSRLILDKQSTLIVNSGAVLNLDSKCKLILRNYSTIIIEKGADYKSNGAKIICKNGSEVIIK